MFVSTRKWVSSVSPLLCSLWAIVELWFFQESMSMVCTPATQNYDWLSQLLERNSAVAERWKQKISSKTKNMKYSNRTRTFSHRVEPLLYVDRAVVKTYISLSGTHATISHTHTHSSQCVCLCIASIVTNTRMQRSVDVGRTEDR